MSLDKSNSRPRFLGMLHPNTVRTFVPYDREPTVGEVLSFANDEDIFDWLEVLDSEAREIGLQIMIACDGASWFVNLVERAR